VSAALTALALAAVAASLTVPATETAAPPVAPGSRGVMRTVIDGTGPVDVPVRFLGTLEDWIGPGRDVYLVELEGPVAEEVGVASGMSGSPVFVDGKPVGALAYRYGLIPKRPIGGVTPFRDVLAAREGTGAALPAAARGLTPIATPLAISGLAEPVRRWLEPALERAGLIAVGGAGSTSSRPATTGPYPGMPVGVLLVGGDVVFAATGTVTWVDGDTLYAFGHPFLGAGRTELPMVNVEVVHTMPDLAGSFKMANVGGELGAIVGDRLTAIVGRVGAHARVVPVEMTVRGGGYGERRFEFLLAPHPTLAPQLAAAAVANAMLRDTGFDDSMTVVGGGRIRLAGLPDIPLEMAFSGSGASSPALAVAGELRSVLSPLFDNPFEPPPVESIELKFEVALDRHEYRLMEVLHDRGPVVPGAALRLDCVLQGYRGKQTRKTLELRVPDTLPPGTTIVVAVGSDPWIQGAARSGESERVESARDLPSLVRALSRPAAENRLAAVLYRAAPSAAAGGEVLAGLPASASRLLAIDGSPGAAAPGRFAALARADADLAGPVEGGVALTLKVGRRVTGDE